MNDGLTFRSFKQFPFTLSFRATCAVECSEGLHNPQPLEYRSKNSRTWQSRREVSTGSSRTQVRLLKRKSTKYLVFCHHRATEKGAALDVFAVLGLPADNAGLTQYGARQHLRKRVARHVAERGAAPPTVGPWVPLWSHVNVAKAILLDEATPEQFEQQKEDWKVHSVQTWNPFATVGSPRPSRLENL